jgi:hypothetical protein
MMIAVLRTMIDTMVFDRLVDDPDAVEAPQSSRPTSVLPGRVMVLSGGDMSPPLDRPIKRLALRRCCRRCRQGLIHEIAELPHRRWA